MDNIELEEKIKEILKEDNYFNMVMSAKLFEKEYKETSFYKATKKPLEEVLKEAKVYYAMQLNDVSEKIQEIIANLDLEKLEDLMDQVEILFSGENKDIQELSSNLKKIFN